MPWHRNGTITLTSGSETVTGSSTSFSANARVGDALILSNGQVYEITNIASATVLSIRPNYQGTTASGQAYAIAPMQGYVKESADRLRQLVDQYGSQLSALQPWSTSATPAAAREALGASASGGQVFTGTPAQGRTALGLGSAATANVQASSTSTTAGELMAVGAFGLGSTAAAGPALNDRRVNGWSTYTGSDPDAPGAASGTLLTLAHSVNYCHQIALTLVTNNHYERFYNAGTWGPWRKTFHDGNILGIVSQSGGVPTGAAFQFTQTASGQTWRNAAGLQICTNSNNPITTDPAAFVGTPTSLDGNKMKVGRWF